MKIALRAIVPFAVLGGCALLSFGAPYAAMTDADVALAAQALQVAMESHDRGVPQAWQNPASGNSGTITPGIAFVTDRGIFCRDYQDRVTAGRRSGTSNGTACRLSDGTWRPQG